jgi:hypothetical protein
MRNKATAHGHFSTLTVGLAVSAALLAAAVLAAGHGLMAHYPSNLPPLGTFLSPTTVLRIIEVCSNGLRYRHWAIGAVQARGLPNLWKFVIRGGRRGRELA